MSLSQLPIAGVIISTTNNNQTLSPCVGNCCLNEKDICLGCFRALPEIVGWQSKPEDEKKAIIARCQQRKAQQGNNQL